MLLDDDLVLPFLGAVALETELPALAAFGFVFVSVVAVESTEGNHSLVKNRKAETQEKERENIWNMSP